MFQLTTTPPPELPRPASPQVTLLCITSYLQTELDALTHTSTTAAAGADGAFTAARGIQQRTLQGVLNHLWAMDHATSRAEALTEHERRIEQLATLSPRVVHALDDENHPNPAVAGWVIASRAHAAQFRPRSWWQRLLRGLSVRRG